MREMLFSPQRLVQQACKITGWGLVNKHGIEATDGEFGIPMLDVAVEEANEWTDRYEGSGQGFGSSDMTYAVMGYIQELVRMADQNEKLEVGFYPSYLEVRGRVYPKVVLGNVQEGMTEDIAYDADKSQFIGVESGQRYHMKGNLYHHEWVSDHDYKALMRADQQLVEAGIVSQETINLNPIIS